MAGTFPSWLSKAADAIRRLAEHPWTLFALLLAMNAIGRPCSSSAHDGRLYSLQALNHAEHGAYTHDVFLQFGSQDQFSLFSHTAGPMVRVLGLRLTFFVLYLIFNTLFILALFRLVRALIDDAVVSTLALIFLVTASLPYGGHDIFMVHEQFFTPRIVGTAMTLFALERLLRQHYLVSGLLLVAGGLVHPLMAFGGVMIWIGCFAWHWLPTRLLVGSTIAASLLGLAMLGIPAIATRFFGSIDDEWHHMIRLAVGYNYPDSWSFKDWINLTVSFATLIAACVWLFHDDRVRRRFLLVTTVAGAVGFVTTLIASWSPYALLFQGQPYRVLWILKVLQVSLGFLLIARWGQSNIVGARVAALMLVAFFSIVHYVPFELQIIARMLLLSICWDGMKAILSEPSARRAFDWYMALARGFVLGAVAWSAVRCGEFFRQWEVVFGYFDLNEWVLFDLIGPMVWIAAFCLAAAWFWSSAPRYNALGWAAAAVALFVPITLFATEVSANYQREHTRLGNDIAFLREFIQARSSTPRVPAVYSSLGRPDLIWIDVKAVSYFDILQTAGVMFNRRTADEIQRRIPLVSKFEMARQRQETIFHTEEKKIALERLFHLPFHSSDAAQADLARLCQEPGLDYVVIPQEFPGLCSASNGRIFVYECEKVRTALGLDIRQANQTVIAAR